MNVLQAIKKLEELQSDLNYINQGVRYFSTAPNKHIKCILNEEQLRIQKEINDFKLRLEQTKL